VSTRNFAKALVLAGVCALVVPMFAFAAKPDPGVFRGTYPVAAGPNTLRVRVAMKQHRGNFTLPCAGVSHQTFTIKHGRYRVIGGKNNPVFKAVGRFTQHGTKTRGKIKKVAVNGAECSPGHFHALHI
jgi:hypothetical protein